MSAPAVPAASEAAAITHHELAIAYRERPWYERRRRALDLTVASLALLAAAPALALAAVAIKLEDGGPVLFEQKRVGRYGRLFTIYKLRTMRTTMLGDALSPTAGTDTRITRVGKWLRKSSIDELPQLLNVVKGDMAIVGPRPEMPFIVKTYAPWQHLRHLAKPGITGLWQTTVRSQIPLRLPEATRIDLRYVHSARTRTDLKLVLATFGSLLSTRGAY